MRLRPQNSAKELLESHLESLRAEISSLSEEKNALVKGLNELKSEVSAEGERLMSSLRETEGLVAGKKAELLNEVLSLEARKAEALKPIKEKEVILSLREKRAEEQRLFLSEMERKIGEQRHELAEKFSEVSDLKASLLEKHEEADRRLERVQKSEEIHRKSLIALNQEWRNFREASSERSKALDERETNVSLRENAVESEKKWCVGERDRIVAFKRQVQSERDAVHSAFEELRRKKL